MSDAGEGPREPRSLDTSLRSLLGEDGLERSRVALWLGAALALFGLWQFFWDVTPIIILGLFLYYVTRPVFDRIHTHVDNRTLAVAVAILTVALPVVLLIGWTVVIVVEALASVFSAETQEQVEAVVGPIVEAAAGTDVGVLEFLLTDPVGFYRTELGAALGSLLEGLLASLAVVGSVGLQAFIVLVIAFYLLRDDYRIAAWARRTFAEEGGVVETYLVQVDRDLKNVYFGNILNALVTGLLAVTTYLVLNAFAPRVVVIPEPALLGMLVGAASLVPAIGIKLVTWPLGLYLLARAAVLDPTTLWFPVVFFVVNFVVVDYIPDQLLRPYVSGRTLHVGVIMLAYLFGPILFGWYGIFVGPFLLVVLFEFGRIVVPWLFDPETVPEPPAEEAPDEAAQAEPVGDETVEDTESPDEASVADGASGSDEETVPGEQAGPDDEPSGDPGPGADG